MTYYEHMGRPGLYLEIAGMHKIGDSLTVLFGRRIRQIGVVQSVDEDHMLTLRFEGGPTGVYSCSEVAPPRVRVVCQRCHGLGRVYTSEGTADCPCGAAP